ncbi:MAG: hypothetical protein H6Q64_2254, partial [Firmicutes bacterium]|nr:hypothetical protein [Bacillota bacterium]
MTPPSVFIFLIRLPFKSYSYVAVLMLSCSLLSHEDSSALINLKCQESRFDPNYDFLSNNSKLIASNEHIAAPCPNPAGLNNLKMIKLL